MFVTGTGTETIIMGARSSWQQINWRLAYRHLRKGKQCKSTCLHRTELFENMVNHPLDFTKNAFFQSSKGLH